MNKDVAPHRQRPGARWCKLLSVVSAAVLPQDCFVCGATSGAALLCAPCRAELPRGRRATEGQAAAGQAADMAAVCPRCALPASGGKLCGQCLLAPPAFDATQALFEYAFPVDRLVHALKYQHRLAVADFFAAELDAIAAGSSASADLILPMPVHARRLRERGFNQAVEIARPFARRHGLRLELAAVRKVRDTPAQAGLDRQQRLRSPRGAFACTRALDGLRIVVVDDVMTSGATLNELATCLKGAGAIWVGNLVCARTPLPY